jgi:hypothetical protein
MMKRPPSVSAGGSFEGYFAEAQRVRLTQAVRTGSNRLSFRLLLHRLCKSDRRYREHAHLNKITSFQRVS